MARLYLYIDNDCRDDIKKEANKLGITIGQAVERRWYGYVEKEKIAHEERLALVKQIEKTGEIYKIIEKWWKKKINIIKSCEDILKEEIENEI